MRRILSAYAALEVSVQRIRAWRGSIEGIEIEAQFQAREGEIRGRDNKCAQRVNIPSTLNATYDTIVSKSVKSVTDGTDIFARHQIFSLGAWIAATCVEDMSTPRLSHFGQSAFCLPQVHDLSTVRLGLQNTSPLGTLIAYRALSTFFVFSASQPFLSRAQS